MSNKITQDSLKQLLHYDEYTENFIWKNYPDGKRKYNGTLAGSLDTSHGYIVIMLGSIKYRAHNLAWLYMTGDWPPKGYIVDHKDTLRHNNSWLNLRLATQAQNTHNSSISTRNTSGYKGISKDKRNNTWRVDISYKGIKYRSGHVTLEEAVAKVTRLREELHGDFANHG